MSTPGVHAGLQLGRLRWDLLRPFPLQSAVDRAEGDSAVAELGSLLDAAGEVGPARVPDRLVADLAAKGFLGLGLPAADGGLGLSPYNVFRVIGAASVRSAAVALLLAVHNGLGAGAYLSAVPPGPLHDYVRARLAEGTLCGMADTEPQGAANRSRNTEALLHADGRNFLLSGEKVFIGNGRIAGLLTVTATVRDGGPERIGLFLVDTADEGFHVVAGHDFMGFEGAPSAALRLDRVRVPRERMLVAADGEWRLSPTVGRINTLARMYVTTAPALGIAGQAVRWAADFVSRRRVDGRALRDYDAVARSLAAARADVFAVDSVARWCLLGDERLDLGPERTAAKNIGSMTAWRVVDSMMSLFGAEGYETAAGKARRGAPAVPVERALRDVRGLRVAGGVDFLVDHRAARFGLFPRYYGGAGGVAEPADEVLPAVVETGRLSPTNAASLRFVAAESRRFARRCLALTREYGEAELYERETLLVTANRIVDELFTMSVVLARADDAASEGDVRAGGLAEVYCGAARRRVAALWAELDALAGEDEETARLHRELARDARTAGPDLAK